MALYIVTDSSADLPIEIIKKFNIDVLPLSVTINDEEYFDGVTIGNKELMDKMRVGAAPKTSQVTVSAFFEVFEKHAKKGDGVICLTLASTLSGTYNSASLAKGEILEKYPNSDITLIDSGCASLGLGMVVYKALLMLSDNASKEEIINVAEDNCQHMQHIFMVDDLEYLFRGGRIGRTSALVGGLLGIKPILELNVEGKVTPLEKARGRKNSIKRMAEIVGERGKNLDNQVIGISHGDDLEAVEILTDLLKEFYGCKEFIINNVGGVIGSHTGPGTLAVFFLN